MNAQVKTKSTQLIVDPTRSFPEKYLPLIWELSTSEKSNFKSFPASRCERFIAPLTKDNCRQCGYCAILTLTKCSHSFSPDTILRVMFFFGCARVLVCVVLSTSGNSAMDSAADDSINFPGWHSHMMRAQVHFFFFCGVFKCMHSLADDKATF